jgi:hypothetical protein
MPAKVTGADRVEVSWDSAKNKWLVRIQAGEEVVRRYSALPKNADESALQSATLKSVQEEGYEADAGRVAIRR